MPIASCEWLLLPFAGQRDFFLVTTAHAFQLRLGFCKGLAYYQHYVGLIASPLCPPCSENKKNVLSRVHFSCSLARSSLLPSGSPVSGPLPVRWLNFFSAFLRLSPSPDPVLAGASICFVGCSQTLTHSLMKGKPISVEIVNIKLSV